MGDLTDRIAAAIETHRKHGGWVNRSTGKLTRKCACGWNGDDYDRHLAHEIATVVHPEIRTVEELDAIPVGTVLLSADGWAVQRRPGRWLPFRLL